MNKMIKLPLFLGICGAACAGILAGVNAFTQPIIEQTKADAAAKAYFGLYSNLITEQNQISVKGTVDAEMTDELFDAGVKEIAVVEDAKGRAYKATTNGYAGTIEFIVAFANGEYLGYTDLGNVESRSYIISMMNDLIKGISSSEKLMENSKYINGYTGNTVTATAIANVIEVCRVDYNNWYSTL